MCIRNRNRPDMSQPTDPMLPSADLRGGTRILIDLERELTPAELNQFVTAATEAGAPTLTDHFLNLTLRLPKASR